MVSAEFAENFTRRMAAVLTDEEFARLFMPDGTVARRQQWDCEDGWYVEYGTVKAEGGPHDGKYVVQVFKPVGKGARTGKAKEWHRVVFSGYSKRRTARQHALIHYYKHSPDKAKRHGWNGREYARGEPTELESRDG